MPDLLKLQLRNVLISLLLVMFFSVATYAQEVRKLTFDGTLSEVKIPVKDMNPAIPADWTGYTHLVMEMRTSSPQRFSIWLYRTDGTPIRVMVQPFGQNVWLRASLPVQYFVGKDKSGNDLASANNRRTNSFWFSTWGPFGEIKAIESIGFAMEYPVNKPTIEIRAVHLSTKDEGSEFLEKLPVLDEFNQWANADWPGKLKSKEQLAKELADEEKTFGKKADFNYCEYGGYQNTKAKATGFFRVEQVDGKWWFVDPHGHLFLSTGSNGAGAGFGQRPGSQRMTTAGTAQVASPGNQQAQNSAGTVANPIVDRITPRLKAWGMTTGGKDMAYTVMLRWQRTPGTSFLGLPDVYSEEFARSIDQSANTQCSPLKDDPFVLGYFVGNEPAFDGRESEVADMILTGPNTATQNKLKEFLTQSDTPKRRKEFIINAFEKYLDLIITAVKKYDPNHLTLGIRFGGSVSDELLNTARIFDVCSINVYEYEPMWQVNRAARYTGRPVLLGEFHIGVPANGLGAGLVQAKDQTERGIAYRYYVEQAASVSGFLGAYWFQWRDEPVLGRMDGENYNIGFVDVNDRPYKELVEAAKATNKRLYDVHSGKVLPFNQRPKASDAGTPSSPWSF
ncbi:MAG: hypothetical protein NTY07_10700 [Bacteroidia bacterium]|nr:hypothetical protein [Bacteroidia bacterium]